MDKRKHQKNMIIGGLLAVVLVMAIGYAAFATSLNISGTSTISSSWNIQITNIRGVNYCEVIEPETQSTTPSEENTVEFLPNTTSDAKVQQMESVSCDNKNNAYDVTAPSVGEDNLSAEFKTGLVTPGDTRIYEIEVTNLGSLDAQVTSTLTNNSNNSAIEFSYDGVSATSKLSDEGYYNSSSLSKTEPFTLKANTNNVKYLYITVKYSDSVTSQPSNLSANIKLTLNATQKAGVSSSGGSNLSDNMVYSLHTNSVYREDDVDNIGDYTTDPATLNSNFFLGHGIDDNKVVASYACFMIDETTHCLRGEGATYNSEGGYYENDSVYYSSNRTTLLNAFGEDNCEEGSWEDNGVTYSYTECSLSGLDAGADDGGFVRARASGTGDCGVDNDGESYCHLSGGGGGIVE